MGGIGDIFNLVFMGPVINLLILIYQGLQAVHFPGALGLAIILLTLLIRILVWPFMSSQIKATKKMADLKPHLAELKKKHSDNKQALAQAQMALYKEHGVNPAGGCLPALIQIPIFIALYQAILNVFPGGSSNLDYVNSLLYFPNFKLAGFPDPNFFGLNIASKPFDHWQTQPAIVLVPLLTALLTFVQSKMMMPKAISHHRDESPKETKEKEGMEDAMASVQGQMVFLMPIMIGYFAFSFPVGLAIYWNAYTILGIIQQHRVAGWGGMSGIAEKLYGKKLG